MSKINNYRYADTRAMDPAGPNLPGFQVDRSNSWIHRSAEGFKNGSRPGSASAMRRDKSTQNIKEIISPPISPFQQSQNNSRPQSAHAGGSSAGGHSYSYGSASFGDLAALNTAPGRRNFRPNTASAGRSSTGRSNTQDFAQLNNQNSNNRASNNLDVLGVPPYSPKRNDSPGQYQAQVPDHVVFEKQVLRFYGQFSEKRPWEENGPLGDPTIETDIVRNLTIKYFLEDNTCSMGEGGASNGMAGGTFCKRAQLKKGDGSLILPIDFAVGNSIQVLGQNVLIYDCDKKTRDYFRQVLRVIMSSAISVPPKGREDLGVAMAIGGGTHFKKEHDPNGNFGTRSGGYEERKEAMAKSYAYLNLDGRSLHFEAVLCGKKNRPTEAELTVDTSKRFTITYSLAENIMSIQPSRVKRTSYDETTSMLKKSRLAKNWRDMNKGKEPIYYQPSDLICGQTIECYGRYLLLVDCDNVTRRIYEDEGILQRRVELFPAKVREQVIEVPKLGDGFLAIGSDEDTLGTVHGFPKPTKDLEKARLNQGRQVRCKTRMITDVVTDQGREFMVTFYLEDDHIQIYEETVRNSGLVGGNFLKKGKYMNTLPCDSDEPRFFTVNDFYLGNVFCINGSEMRITMMDNMTLRFLESYPKEFPMFNTFAIVDRLKNTISKDGIDVRTALWAHDTKRKGYLSKELYVAALDTLGISTHLNDQELLTVMRRFQNDNNCYQYDEMCDLISHAYYLGNKRSNRRKTKVAGNGDEELDEQSKFMNYLRGHKTQLRRLCRKNVHAINGNLTLHQLLKLMGRYGFKVSEGNKNFIVKRYALSRAEAAPLLAALNRPNDLDQLEDVNIDSSKPLRPMSSSGTRLDIKSSTRMGQTGGDSIKSPVDVKGRRAQIMQSVLRKPPTDTGDFQQGGLDATTSQFNEKEIVISYRTFCDEVYKSDW